MLVSIIIPVYNCEKYIEQAILSAVHQSYKDTEVIVINDGSTDKTVHIVLELMKKYPIHLFSKKNGGTASALNAGIQVASGKWIKWLSADDVLYPGSIELMMDHAKYKDTIYYSNYDIIDAKGKLIGTWKENPDKPTSYLWKKFFGNGSTTLIHKHVFDKCGLFADMPHSEDYEFWLRATQIYGIKMELIPETTIAYRRHPGQLTNKVGGSLDEVIKERIRERQASSG